MYKHKLLLNTTDGYYIEHIQNSFIIWIPYKLTLRNQPGKDLPFYHTK